MKLRTLLATVVASTLGIALIVPLAGPAAAESASASAQSAGSSRGSFPSPIDLPDGFLPEGITIGRGGIAYFGSRGTGDIYAASLRTGKGTIISEGPGTPSVGLKIDRKGRIFVAGGTAGDGRVVDARTGDILASYQFAAAPPTFVNDVVLTRTYAWFTDSLRPQLYGVPLNWRKDPPAADEVVTLDLTGAWEQTPGVNNANGIAVTPDRSALLVVQSNTGLLFRVDPRTGVAVQVDLGGALLTNGDGLLVQGRTLYAVQNRLNRVAVVQLNRSGTTGVLVHTLTSPDFDVPTTIAAFGRSLYLPNARFTTPPTPDTEYWVTRIRARCGH